MFPFVPPVVAAGDPPGPEKETRMRFGLAATAANDSLCTVTKQGVR